MAVELAALWPSDIGREKFLFLRVPHSVDDLFNLLFVKPEFHEKFVEHCEVHKYVTTNWLKTAEEVPAEIKFEDTFDCSTLNPPGLEYRYKKVRLQQGGNKLTEADRAEYLQLTEFYPGQRYVVEIHVQVVGKEDTVTMWRHFLLLPDDASNSKLIVTFGIKPISNNPIARFMIYRTVKGNVCKSAEAYKGALEAFGAVQNLHDNDCKPYMQTKQVLPPLVEGAKAAEQAEPPTAELAGLAVTEEVLAKEAEEAMVAEAAAAEAAKEEEAAPAE